MVNSFASSVTPRNTVVVHRRLSRDHDVEVVETNRRGHATRFADDAARRGLDAVVAFGGDGTLNEVASGVAGTNTALGVLPGGSTNVFARTIGLENDPVAAADTLAEALLEGSIDRVGLGAVNGRHFCFHTGVGFDAAVVAAVERHASLKRWLGHPLFIWSSVSTWTRGFDRTKPNHSVVSADGRSIDGAFLTVLLNSSPYTYLGNRPVDIDAELVPTGEIENVDGSVEITGDEAGLEIELDVRSLPPQIGGEFYQVWVALDDGRIASAGTFLEGAELTLQAAVPLERAVELVVTLATSGEPGAVTSPDDGRVVFKLDLPGR